MGRYGNLNPNYRGLGELLRGPEMVAHMLARVERAKVAAESEAPVGPPSDPHRGEYKDSFRAEAAPEKSAKGERAVGRLTNSAPHAVDVEYGGGGRAEAPAQGAHHTMTRSIDAMRD